MNYKIDNIPLADYGLQPGWINKKSGAFALEGIFNLPERTGETFYQWPTGIEPFVDADDIVLGSRDLILTTVCKADSLTAFRYRLNTVYTALNREAVVSCTELGNFKVVVKKTTVRHFNNGWGEIVFHLVEENPVLLPAVLPEPSGAASGIDGYGWAELGFVVSSLAGRYDLPEANPVGRDYKTLALSATLKGTTFVDFTTRVARLQKLFTLPGLRTVRYFDGTGVACFAANGFTIKKIKATAMGFWGDFEIKLIVSNENI